MTFSIENPEGVATTPLSENMFGKTLRITRVKAKSLIFVVLKKQHQRLNENRNIH